MLLRPELLVLQVKKIRKLCQENWLMIVRLFMQTSGRAAGSRLEGSGPQCALCPEL